MVIRVQRASVATESYFISYVDTHMKFTAFVSLLTSLVEMSYKILQEFPG